MRQAETRRKWEATVARDELLANLRYEPDTGHFYWVKTGQGPRKMGVPIGAVSTAGHIQIYYNKRLWQAHRLAWFMANGVWPQNDIDHINRDKTDNRLANLREATRAQNCANIPAQKNNRTGFRGVHPTKSGRYSASISVAGTSKNLGTFSTPGEAAVAYLREAFLIYGDFSIPSAGV